LACLCFDDPHYDHRAFHTRAHQLLEEHRWIAQTDLWAAAAVGHVRALTDLLDEQPNRVNAAGPYGWTPLLCACYSRAKPVAEEFSTFAAASLLLERGADPNAYTLKGNADERLDQTPRRYAVLSGVFGGGTTGPANEPPHPSWRALAEMLLAYGANPADEEALRHNTPAALPVLLEHGLKPDATGSDGTTLMGSALARAAMRGDLEHVQLLVAHGARLEETV
jgi:ankyrin repeat protein